MARKRYTARQVARQAALISRWVTPQAGGWGLPGTGIYPPPRATLADYSAVTSLPIRAGEGTGTAIVTIAGTAIVQLGPDALTTWYVSYCAISTSTGAADASTCQVVIGPAGAGIVPGGQSYAGGGDSVSLGGTTLKPGNYVIALWSGGHPGDTATMTIYGDQDILV